MFFVGIDMAKKRYEAYRVNLHGERTGKFLSFPNTQAEGQQLLYGIQKQAGDLKKVNIAMEATSHYWLALFSFLRKQGAHVQVINPFQSDAFRKLWISKN